MRSHPTILTLAGLACMLAAPPAFAHAHLKMATPADNAKVSGSPASLLLDFTEDLNLVFSDVDIINASGGQVPHGKPTLDGGTVLSVPIEPVLAPGSYTVKWHVLAADGHKSEGSYSFTVNP